MFVTNNHQAAGKIDTYLDRLQDLWGEEYIEEVWGEQEIPRAFLDNPEDKNINKNHLNVVRDNGLYNWEIAA